MIIHTYMYNNTPSGFSDGIFVRMLLFLLLLTCCIIICRKFSETVEIPTKLNIFCLGFWNI